MRKHLIDLYVKTGNISEEERDHGLGAVEVNYGPHWLPEFCDEVAGALIAVMTDEEKRAAWSSLG